MSRDMRRKVSAGGGQIRAKLDALPAQIALDVASKITPTLTQSTQASFAAGRTVYGTPRPASEEDGRALELERTGAAKQALTFRVNGTRSEVRRGPRYLKYLIARYWVLPPGNKYLPPDWRSELEKQVKASGDAYANNR